MLFIYFSLYHHLTCQRNIIQSVAVLVTLHVHVYYGIVNLIPMHIVFRKYISGKAIYIYPQTRCNEIGYDTLHVLHAICVWTGKCKHRTNTS